MSPPCAQVLTGARLLGAAVSGVLCGAPLEEDEVRRRRVCRGGDSPLTLRSSFHAPASESIVSILGLLIFEVLRNPTYRDDSS